MKLSDIKRGDILVAKHNDLEDYQFERDYIIFIASGSNITKKKIRYMYFLHDTNNCTYRPCKHI